MEKQEEVVDVFKSFHHLDMKIEDFYYGWIYEKIMEQGNIKLHKKWYHKIKHFCGRTPIGIAGLSFAILVVVSIFTTASFLCTCISPTPLL